MDTPRTSRPFIGKQWCSVLSASYLAMMAAAWLGLGCSSNSSSDLAPLPDAASPAAPLDGSLEDGDGGVAPSDAPTPRCGVESQMVCDGECVDLRFDRLHCGACGSLCEEGSHCVDGECVPECFGLDRCGDTCVDLLISDVHCGVCGNACGDGESCNRGSCSCDSGVYRSDGSCCVLGVNLAPGADPPGSSLDENCETICAAGTSEICHDGQDNDCDGHIDCNDSDCDGQICGEFGFQCSDSMCACPDNAVEFCDARDGDCDGVINNGCPSGLALTGSETAAGFVGDTAAADRNIRCGANEALVGMVFRANGSGVHRFEPYCAPLNLVTDESTSPDWTYTLAIDGQNGARSAGAFGSSSGTVRSQFCPAHQVVTGFQGDQYERDPDNEFDLFDDINSFGIRCGLPNFVRSDRGLDLQISEGAILPVEGDSGGPLRDSQCGPGRVGIGIRIGRTSSDSVLGVDMYCRSLAVSRM